MAAGSAAIEPLDQYVSPIEDAEKETLPVVELKRVNVCLCIPLCFCVCGFGDLCLDVSISVYGRSVFCVRITGRGLLTQTNQKPQLLLMPPFPRQRLPSRDGKSLPLCFSAFSPSILSIQSAAVALCGIN